MRMFYNRHGMLCIQDFMVYLPHSYLERRSQENILKYSFGLYCLGLKDNNRKGIQKRTCHCKSNIRDHNNIQALFHYLNASGIN